MSDKNTVSPALSRLEIRAKDIKTLNSIIDSKRFEVNKHAYTIESLNFELDELIDDLDHMYSRISQLVRDALSEGYSIERIHNFIKYDLKLKNIIQHLDSDIQRCFNI